MDNKFIRYCIVEPKCRLRIIGLLLLIAMIMGLVWYRGTQNVRLSTLKIKGAMIARITDMEHELETKAQKLFAEEKIPKNSIHIERFADLRYEGQSSELTIPVSQKSKLADRDITKIISDFHTTHKRVYEYARW